MPFTFDAGFESTIILRVALAALIGGILGLEREWSAKSAGLRTNMLVAMGSALFTALSIFGFGVDEVGTDKSRVASQIVVGIGFLGAGAIWRSQAGIKGLTTAATIWVVAAIGMAAGAGLPVAAVAIAVFAWIVLVLFERVEAWLGRRRSVRVQPARSDGAGVESADSE